MPATLAGTHIADAGMGCPLGCLAGRAVRVRRQHRPAGAHQSSDGSTGIRSRTEIGARRHRSHEAELAPWNRTALNGASLHLELQHNGVRFERVPLHQLTTGQRHISVAVGQPIPHRPAGMLPRHAGDDVLPVRDHGHPVPGRQRTTGRTGQLWPDPAPGLAAVTSLAPPATGHHQPGTRSTLGTTARTRQPSAPAHPARPRPVGLLGPPRGQRLSEPHHGLVPGRQHASFIVQRGLRPPIRELSNRSGLAAIRHGRTAIRPGWAAAPLPQRQRGLCENSSREHLSDPVQRRGGDHPPVRHTRLQRTSVPPGDAVRHRPEPPSGEARPGGVLFPIPRASDRPDDHAPPRSAVTRAGSAHTHPCSPTIPSICSIRMPSEVASTGSPGSPTTTIGMPCGIASGTPMSNTVVLRSRSHNRPRESSHHHSACQVGLQNWDTEMAGRSTGVPQRR